MGENTLYGHLCHALGCGECLGSTQSSDIINDVWQGLYKKMTVGSKNNENIN